MSPQMRACSVRPACVLCTSVPARYSADAAACIRSTTRRGEMCAHATGVRRPTTVARKRCLYLERDAGRSGGAARGRRSRRQQRALSLSSRAALSSVSLCLCSLRARAGGARCTVRRRGMRREAREKPVEASTIALGSRGSHRRLARPRGLRRRQTPRYPSRAPHTAHGYTSCATTHMRRGPVLARVLRLRTNTCRIRAAAVHCKVGHATCVPTTRQSGGH